MTVGSTSSSWACTTSTTSIRRIEKSGEGAEAKSLAVFVIFVFSIIGRPHGFLFSVFLMGSLGTVIKLVRFLRKGKAPEAAPVR